MSSQPPGIRWMKERLPAILSPPLAVCALYLLSPTKPPLWLFLLGLPLSYPITLTFSTNYKDYVDRRAAEAHGAVLPTRSEDWTPGNLLSLRAALADFRSGYVTDGFLETTIRLGPVFNLRLLFENRMFTSEPEHIKAILATQFANHVKGEVLYIQLESVLGAGVFNSDGEMWKFHRTMTRPFFNRDRISHFDIFDRLSDDVIKQIDARQKEGYPIDFQDAVSRFTLDSATEFLFGYNLHTLSAGLLYPENNANTNGSPSPGFASMRNAEMAQHPANRFATAFVEVQRTLPLRSRYGVHWPLLEFWRDATADNMRILGEAIDPILRDAAARKKRNAGAAATRILASTAEVQSSLTQQDVEKTPLAHDDEVKDGELGEGVTMLEHLLNYTDDEKLLKDEILNIMIAGRDTTASTLTFVVYMLSQHPHVLERLRAEIFEKVGSTQRPTYDNLKSMKYLRAVINETLRLYPPVPLNLRSSNKAVLWPPLTPGGKPFYIPPNTKTGYSVLIMHRREDLWGPDAQEFDPDRFIDERLHKYLVPNPFIFLPFNAGPRICLGQQFAYNEISFFLVRLLQNFSSISLAEDTQLAPPPEWKLDGGRKAKEKIRTALSLTLSVRGGLWVRMERSTADM